MANLSVSPENGNDSPSNLKAEMHPSKPGGRKGHFLVRNEKMWAVHTFAIVRNTDFYGAFRQNLSGTGNGTNITLNSSH